MTNEKLTTLITDGSMTADITSPSINLSRGHRCSVQCVFTGSPVGTLTLLVSNEETGTYTTVTPANQAISAAGDHVWNLSEIGYPYLKFKYVFTSGSGTINVKIFSKEIL